jgi:hypothetical protein
MQVYKLSGAGPCLSAAPAGDEGAVAMDVIVQEGGLRAGEGRGKARVFEQCENHLGKERRLHREKREGREEIQFKNISGFFFAVFVHLAVKKFFSCCRLPGLGDGAWGGGGR